MARKLQHDVGKDQRGRLLIDTYITLIEPGERREEDIKTGVFATVNPIGRDEFAAAGQKSMKARYKFDVWESEYNDEQELLYKGSRLTIYRTYGPRSDGKMELYAGERAGNI